jgi:membrane glycosyltransferase
MKIALCLSLLVIALNAIATWRVLRSPLLSPAQTTLQLALVWLLPVLGAVLCLAFAASVAGEEARTRERDRPEAPGDEFRTPGDSAP